MLSIKRSSLACVSEASYHHCYHLALSADTISSNADLLTEILLCLPIRSLFRSKSVSKHWLSLITHRYFSHCHQILNCIPSGLFLQLYSSSRLNNPEYEFVSFNDPLTFTPPFRTHFHTRSIWFKNSTILQWIVLFCCSSQTRNLKRKYYVYNHTTKQFTTLPTLGFGSPRPVVHGVNFAFDPSKSPHYKVICVRSSDLSSEHYQIEIYSSNTGPWRVSGQPFTAHVNIQFNGGVYWNGAIHWLSIREDSLCFDVDKECLQIMPMPPLPSGYDRRWFNYFGESGDHLHLIERYRPPSTQFNIYALERERLEWFVKYQIDLGSVAAEFPGMIPTRTIAEHLNFYNFVILSVVRRETTDGGESSFMVLHINGKVMWYSFEDKSFGGRPICFPFIESLSCF